MTPLVSYQIFRIIFNKEKQRNSHHTRILTTYKNSIQSTTKYNPFEIFHERPHLLTHDVTPNNEHDYLQKLKEFRNNIYPDIKENMDNGIKDRITKNKENRNPPEALEEGKTVFRKKNRRNKLLPRFSKHQVKQDKGQSLFHTKIKRFINRKLRKKHNSNYSYTF